MVAFHHGRKRSQGASMSVLPVAVEGIYVGKLRGIGPDASPTGIFKSPVEGPIAVSTLGLAGDIQVDRCAHGGTEKALYHYPAENYAVLRQALPHLEGAFVPGSIGENLSTHGIDEDSVHIGDIFSVGSALLQVSQPRRPCWKVNHKYGNGHIGALLMSEGISGWYYRVLKEGEIALGDSIELRERLPHSVPVRQIWQLFLERLQQKVVPGSALPEIAGLSPEWQFQ
jgi:MOSC domain-containing protein YiiM